MTTDYGPLLYKRLGYDTQMQLLIQSGWISVCPLGNLFNALVVDRIGRTKLLSGSLPTPTFRYLLTQSLVFGFTGTAIALIGECATVATFQKDANRSVAAAAVFFLFFHIAW